MTSTQTKAATKVSLREVEELLALTDKQLLILAKADLATELARKATTSLSLEEWAELAKYLSAIRFFREKIAKSSGKHLAKLLHMAFQGTENNHPCIKLNYCQNRKKINDTIQALRRAISAGLVVDSLADVVSWLTVVIEAAHTFKMPLSLALLILLYALDDLCGCDKFPKHGEWEFRPEPAEPQPGAPADAKKRRG